MYSRRASSELLSPSARSAATSRSRGVSAPSLATAASRRCNRASTSSRRQPANARQRSRRGGPLTSVGGAALGGQGAGERQVQRRAPRRLEPGRHTSGSAVEEGDDLGVVGAGTRDQRPGRGLVALRQLVGLRRLEGGQHLIRVDAGGDRVVDSADDLLRTVQRPGLLQDFGETLRCRHPVMASARQHQVLRRQTVLVVAAWLVAASMPRAAPPPRLPDRLRGAT